MVYATESTSFDDCDSIISSILDFCLIVKLLVRDIIFDNQPSRGSNKSEFTDLYFCGTKSIAARGLLNLYQHRVYGNWKLRLLLDGRLPTTEVSKKSDIDNMEKVDLLYNSKIDDNSNNN